MVNSPENTKEVDKLLQEISTQARLDSLKEFIKYEEFKQLEKRFEALKSGGGRKRVYA